MDSLAGGCSQASIAALSAKLLPRITFGFATADAAAPSSAHGLPTQAAVYGGVYAQAREFYGPKRGDRDAPGPHCPASGLYACTGGGAFAETVVCTLFGYLPKFGGTPELLNADTPRGFTGEFAARMLWSSDVHHPVSRNWADAGN